MSESIVDVANMWKNLNVNPNLHLYKNGAADCPHGRDVSATAWTCVSTHTGGWNPALLRSWAVERGATLSDTIRATIAHEVAHVVLDGWNSAGDDLMTKEVRADCLAAGYSRWTMTTSDSAMGQLPLERMKNVLYGSKSAKAMDAGYTGTPKTCASWTP
ncbi:hypothetical protein [Mycolicibacterium fallax]|uniref:hypothetical protein n=1 Tax=Mycolicibacterium fallax TaxID=1793 RepID=UPI0013D48BBC|nr:hypothetical protein [Mycolicibacterium fallax]